MNKKTTIYTIAKDAGVSPSTVSRYLTGNANISDEKREKIRHAIEKYNYIPNPSAQNLSNQESRMLGFIIPDVTHPFYGTAFMEAERYAMEYGYTLILCNTLNDNLLCNTNVELRYFDFLREKQVDGIVIIGGHINETHDGDEYIKRLECLANQIPLVLVNSEVKNVNCYKIMSDEESGISTIINYLISCGHREIGFIGGVRGIQPTDKRMNIVKKALIENGISPVDEWFIEGGFDIQSGKKLFNELLRMKEKPTALICFNDLIAIGLIYAAAHRGVRVPEDVSILGFDNIYLDEYVSPALTSLDLMPAQLGKLAVKTLIKHLKGATLPREIMVPTNLVIRDSCTCAKTWANNAKDIL